jgi:hypothetical protein
MKNNTLFLRARTRRLKQRKRADRDLPLNRFTFKEEKSNGDGIHAPDRPEPAAINAYATFMGVVIDTDDRDLHDEIVTRLHVMAEQDKFSSAMHVALMYGSCFSPPSLTLEELTQVLA